MVTLGYGWHFGYRHPPLHHGIIGNADMKPQTPEQIDRALTTLAALERVWLARKANDPQPAFTLEHLRQEREELLRERDGINAAMLDVRP
jgi:hypothetical protein